MAIEELTEQATEKTTKLGIHRDIVAPFIGLIAVSTVAWVAVLVILNRD